MADPFVDKTLRMLAEILGLRTREKPFREDEMMPLIKNKGGYIPGTLDHLAEEQGLASDDPYQIAAKLEAWRRSGDGPPR